MKDTEQSREFFKNRIRERLSEAQDLFKPHPYRILLAMLDDCDDLEELREMAELDLQLEALRYNQSVYRKLLNIDTNFKEIAMVYDTAYRSTQEAILITPSKDVKKKRAISSNEIIKAIDDDEVWELMEQQRGLDELKTPESEKNYFEIKKADEIAAEIDRAELFTEGDDWDDSEGDEYEDEDSIWDDSEDSEDEDFDAEDEEDEGFDDEDSEDSLFSDSDESEADGDYSELDFEYSGDEEDEDVWDDSDEDSEDDQDWLDSVPMSQSSYDEGTENVVGYEGSLWDDSSEDFEDEYDEDSSIGEYSDDEEDEDIDLDDDTTVAFSIDGKTLHSIESSDADIRNYDVAFDWEDSEDEDIDDDSEDDEDAEDSIWDDSEDDFDDSDEDYEGGLFEDDDDEYEDYGDDVIQQDLYSSDTLNYGDEDDEDSIWDSSEEDEDDEDDLGLLEQGMAGASVDEDSIWDDSLEEEDEDYDEDSEGLEDFEDEEDEDEDSIWDSSEEDYDEDSVDVTDSSESEDDEEDADSIWDDSDEDDFEDFDLYTEKSEEKVKKDYEDIFSSNGTIKSETQKRVISREKAFVNGTKRGQETQEMFNIIGKIMDGTLAFFGMAKKKGAKTVKSLSDSSMFDYRQSE